jgi:DNA-binding response OmpR family regulator
VTAKHVLVVDDAPSVTGVLQFVLEAEGYEASIAENGLAALEAVARRRPDLILLDLGVPGLDGYGVCARLQERPETATIPIMLLTGTLAATGSPRLSGYPIKDFVLKPFSPRDLVERIRRVLEAG